MSYTREDLLDLIDWEHSYDYKLDYREEILKEIFLSMRTRELTNIEYVFIAKSFCNKIFMLGHIIYDARYDKNDNYSNIANERFNTFISMSSKAVKLEDNFISEYYELEISDPGAGEDLTDFKKLAKDTVNIYKDIRDWMIEKGYNIE